jgi:Tfp pilus assembly protein PilN
MRAVNLIPAEQRSGGVTGIDAGKSQGAAYVVLGLLGGLALLALLYGMASHQVESRRAEVARVTAQAQQTQAQASRLAPYTSFVALREQRVQSVSQLVNSRFDWAHLMHEVGRVLPASVSVASLDGTVGSATGTGASAGGAATSGAGASSAAGGSSSATSATPPGSVPSFTLSGCALTQKAVARTLERLRLIDGVTDVTLESSTKGTGGSGGSSSGSGGCPPHAPTFTLQFSLAALPTLPASGPVGSTATASTGGTR